MSQLCVNIHQYILQFTGPEKIFDDYANKFISNKTDINEKGWAKICQSILNKNIFAFENSTTTSKENKAGNGNCCKTHIHTHIRIQKIISYTMMRNPTLCFSVFPRLRRQLLIQPKRRPINMHMRVYSLWL